MRATQTAAAAALFAVLLVSAAVTPVAATGRRTATTDTYTGTHVTFTASGNAITDYSVDGATMLQSVAVESKSNYESRTGATLGLDLSSVTSLQGTALAVQARTSTSASVTAESGAKLTAHDNGHGILVVRTDGTTQLVKADVASSTETRTAGESRVVVTTSNGAKGTFIVVGEGTVDVNSEGDVVAQVEGDGKLVFRSYAADERGSDARVHERMIANGTAVGEVYVMAEGSAETVVDTVRYGQETTIEAKQQGENTVAVTVDRAKSQGKVVITQVSEAAVGSFDSLTVTVDGEAAARASTYSELVDATNGGETSKYMVRQTSSLQARGTAQVLVGVTHFSERTITMSGTEDGGTADGSTATDGDESTGGATDGTPTTDTTSPGLGPVVALVALAAAALLARRRH